jgi:hypothetical protein
MSQFVGFARWQISYSSRLGLSEHFVSADIRRTKRRG